MPLASAQIPLLSTRPGDIEGIAVERAKMVRVHRAGEEAKGEAETVTRARAIFDEHGSRDMESAFLEELLKREEESSLRPHDFW